MGSIYSYAVYIALFFTAASLLFVSMADYFVGDAVEDLEGSISASFSEEFGINNSILEFSTSDFKDFNLALIENTIGSQSGDGWFLGGLKDFFAFLAKTVFLFLYYLLYPLFWIMSLLYAKIVLVQLYFIALAIPSFVYIVLGTASVVLITVIVIKLLPFT